MSSDSESSCSSSSSSATSSIFMTQADHELQTSRYAIATLSLGSCELHRLEDKLEAAASSGFTSVELFTADWEEYLRLFLLENNLPARDPDSHLVAARNLRSIFTRLGLRANCLQPVRNVEGILDPTARARKFAEIEAYFPILNILDIDLILICSSIDPQTSNQPSVISRDLMELADTAAAWQARHGGKLIRFAYEALSWGVHVNTWRQAWRCVSLNPRPNLGLIIDSFNSLGREYADPYTPSGLQRSARRSAAFLEKHLQELVATVPGDKIFLFQIADATRPPAHLSQPPSDSAVPRLLPWSRNCRLFPLETERGAYLPVDQYAQAVLATGYKGDLSLEVFNASLHESGPQVPRQHAQRGFKALKKLDATIQDLNLGISGAIVPTSCENARPEGSMSIVSEPVKVLQDQSRPSTPSSPRLPRLPLAVI